jgi:hypothetical protein
MEMRERLSRDVIEGVLARVPDALLADPVIAGEFTSAAAARSRYSEYLLARLAASRAFVDAAVEARLQVRVEPKRRVRARR